MMTSYNKSKMADGRHTENRFLAISRHHIGRSKRNLEQRWKITWRYRSRDQNCNFRKFKMADGRHFENTIIPIAQPRIIRFRSNLVDRCRFHIPWWGFNRKIEILQIQDGGRTPYWKSFLAISQRNIGKFIQVSEWRWRITGRYRSLDQSGNFRKFKMAEGRHFENSFISYSQSELSDFEQIWSADANFHSEDGYLTKNRFFSNSRRTPYWKSFYCYISAPYWPIDAKFEKEMKNHMPIRVRDQNCNFHTFKLAELGRPPFLKQFSVFTSFL